MKIFFQFVYLCVVYTSAAIIDQYSAQHALHKKAAYLIFKPQSMQIKHVNLHQKVHQATPFHHVHVLSDHHIQFHRRPNHDHPNHHVLSDHHIQSHRQPNHNHHRSHHHHPHAHGHRHHHAHHIRPHPYKANYQIVPHVRPAHLASPQLVAHPIHANRRIAVKNQIHPIHRFNPQHKPQLKEHKLQAPNLANKPAAMVDEKKINSPSSYKRESKSFTASLPPTSPTTIRASPTTIRASPTTIRASPTTIRASPTTIRASPTTIRVSPKIIRASPTTTRASPTTTRASPTTIRVSPTFIRSSPTTRVSPTTIRVSPKIIRASPTTTRASPTTIRVSPTFIRSSPTTRVSPTTIRVSPTIIRSFPTTIRASPTTIRVSPTFIRSSPTTRVSPTTIRVSPAIIRSSPTTTRASPTTIRASPTTIRSSPTTIRASPTTIRASPTIIRSSPTTTTSPTTTNTPPKSINTSPTTTITTRTTTHTSHPGQSTTASKLLEYGDSDEQTHHLHSLRELHTIAISSENETACTEKQRTTVSEGLSLGESLSTSEEEDTGSESSEYYDSYYDQDVNRSTTQGWNLPTIDLPKVCNLTSEEARHWRANSSYIISKIFPPEELIEIPNNQTLEDRVRHFFNPQEILPQYMPFYTWYYHLAIDQERIEKIYNKTIYDNIDFHNLSQYTPFPIPPKNQKYYMFVDYVEHLIEREKQEAQKDIDDEKRWEDMLKHPQTGTYYPGFTHDDWFDDSRESRHDHRDHVVHVDHGDVDDEEAESGDEDPYADQSFHIPGETDEDGYGDDDEDDDDEGYSEPIDLLVAKQPPQIRRKSVIKQKQRDPISFADSATVESEESSVSGPKVTGKNKYRKGKQKFITTIPPV